VRLGPKIDSYCKASGEKIIKNTPPGTDSLFIDASGSDFNFRNGNKIKSVGSRNMKYGHKLTAGGKLKYIEYKEKDRKSGKYVFKRKNLYQKSEPVEDVEKISSPYSVISKNMVSEEDKNLGLIGSKTSFIDNNTQEVIATTTFFYSRSHRRFCGHIENNKFSIRDFISRVFNE
jgi:hypothetical protein